MSLAEKFKKFSAGQLSTLQSVSESTTGNRVLVVDGLNAYIRSFAATPTMNDNGDHMGGVTGFLLSVGTVIRQLKISSVVIVFDGQNGSQRRRNMFGGYKNGRKFMTKLNRTYDFKTIEEEIESRQKQFNLLLGALSFLPVTVIIQDNVEGDDVIAYAAQTLESRGFKVFILSNDKDFLQIVNENINVWNPIKKKMYTPDRVTDDYGFHPNNFLLYRSVTGDQSDCIPGVQGIKEKTLLKFFPELAEPDKKDITFLLETAKQKVEGVKKPPVALTTLLASKTQLELNHSLMRLDDVAMSNYNRSEIIRQLDAEPNEYNKLELTKLIRLNRLIAAFGNMESWLMTTFLPLTRYKLNK